MTEWLGSVLVVEDEGLLALALEEILTSVGYRVVGPAPTTRKALMLIGSQSIDAALLDVNLGSERVDVVAQALADAAIPFAFSTGYCTGSALPPGFTEQVILNKPYQPEELLRVVEELVRVGQAAKVCPPGTVKRQ